MKQRFSAFFRSPPGRFLTTRGNVFVNVFMQGGVRKKKLGPDVKAAYRGPFPTVESRMPQTVFPRSIVGARDFLLDVSSGLTALRDTPALIVWGDRDVAFRKHDMTKFQGLFRRQRTVVLRGAGHFIQEDAPDEIAAAIRSWWLEDVEGR